MRHFTVLCVLIFRASLRHGTFKKRMCAKALRVFTALGMIQEKGSEGNIRT
jgi:hypothetical protein